MTTRPTAAELRSAQGAAAVLSVAEALTRLPCGTGAWRSAWMTWLAERRLICAGPAGIEVVIWGHILDELERGRSRPADGSGGMVIPSRQPGRARG